MSESVYPDPPEYFEYFAKKSAGKRLSGKANTHVNVPPLPLPGERIRQSFGLALLPGASAHVQSTTASNSDVVAAAEADLDILAAVRKADGVKAKLHGKAKDLQLEFCKLLEKVSKQVNGDKVDNKEDHIQRLDTLFQEAHSLIEIYHPILALEMVRQRMISQIRRRGELTEKLKLAIDEAKQGLRTETSKILSSSGSFDPSDSNSNESKSA